VDPKKIRFVSNRPWLNEQSASRPEPIIETLSDRYRSKSELRAGGGKIRASAMLEVMASGYCYKTPCDIEFFEDARGDIHGKALDARHQDFLMDRVPLSRFPHPQGYHEKHFAWWPDWAVELPDGYSALYTSPLNRFELPFLTMSGIVDNDQVVLPGTMPFFVLKGVTGVLPAGTPYAQIFPFKREHWRSEIGTPLTQSETGR
jgi:hypothetical protein